jgi:uncharacterized protein
MKYIAIGLIRIYRLCISPMIGQVCRFHPTCSEYALQAFKSYGFFKGMYFTLKRLGKCHPWHPGGLDEIPEND